VRRSAVGRTAPLYRGVRRQTFGAKEGSVSGLDRVDVEDMAGDERRYFRRDETIALQSLLLTSLCICLGGRGFLVFRERAAQKLGFRWYRSDLVENASRWWVLDCARDPAAVGGSHLGSRGLASIGKGAFFAAQGDDLKKVCWRLLL